MSASDEAVRAVGAGVVIRAYQGGGDILNAWEVLYGAFGYSDTQAQAALERECLNRGVDFDDVHKAIQGALNDRSRA